MKHRALIALLLLPAGAQTASASTWQKPVPVGTFAGSGEVRLASDGAAYGVAQAFPRPGARLTVNPYLRLWMLAPGSRRPRVQKPALPSFDGPLESLPSEPFYWAADSRGNRVLALNFEARRPAIAALTARPHRPFGRAHVIYRGYEGAIGSVAVDPRGRGVVQWTHAYAVGRGRAWARTAAPFYFAWPAFLRSGAILWTEPRPTREGGTDIYGVTARPGARRLGKGKRLLGGAAQIYPGEPLVVTETDGSQTAVWHPFDRGPAYVASRNAGRPYGVPREVAGGGCTERIAMTANRRGDAVFTCASYDTRYAWVKRHGRAITDMALVGGSDQSPTTPYDPGDPNVSAAVSDAGRIVMAWRRKSDAVTVLSTADAGGAFGPPEVVPLTCADTPQVGVNDRGRLLLACLTPHSGREGSLQIIRGRLGQG